MYHPRLRGKYYDVGKHYGSILYKNGFVFPEVSKEKIEFGMESLPYLERFYPEIIEEIKGFSEASHTPYEQVSSFLLGIGVFDTTAQCSIFASFQNNEMIVGRNYDMLRNVKPFLESSLVCIENKYRYVSHSDVFIGKVDGLNEKGLFIGMTLVPEEKTRPGINFYFAVRYILEHCQNVNEAIKVLENFHSSLSNNYLIADQSGNMAVVEVGPNHFHVIRPDHGESFIVSTNHFTHATSNPIASWSKTCERKTSMSQFLQEHETLSEQTAKQMMSDTKGHVCLHLNQYNFGTLYSLVLNLNNLTIQRAEGAPNRSKYKIDNRLKDEVLE
ncbi:C45 family peptidase [Alkalihalobacillus sp. LMS39]|uniref:C45 family autoproteolytic acyltransferase/hydolase n=1 Tax=Alkalihalobacillus sp. LMS39 TaxID=2924032 RepID=UPI001FB24CF9|nr:C45 family peptidase [Alkalihalobacillus sp. LMS39]UOE95214.1 C45 family autoproteolytic acyltransferase/hydrolase [Alkalihalobacillus sp. LMS39]